MTAAIVSIVTRLVAWVGDETQASSRGDNDLLLTDADWTVAPNVGDLWSGGKPAWFTGPDLVALRLARCAEVDAMVDAKTVSKSTDAVCATPMGPAQCDQNSRLNITGAVVLAGLEAQLQQPFSINWTMADNSVVTLNGSQMIGFGETVAGYVSACHNNAHALKTRIKAATTAAEANAVDLTQGWP
jgi:hypothetical protein